MAGRPRKRLGVAKAGSGIQDDGTWSPAFEGQRPPFAPGNTAATAKHRFFARITRDEDGEEIAEVADWLADQVPPEHPEAPLILLASMWVRWSRGSTYLMNTNADLWPKALLHHLPVVENSMARLMRGLAMTSEGAAAVGLQVAQRRRVEGGDFNEEDYTEDERRVLRQAETILFKRGAL